MANTKTTNCFDLFAEMSKGKSYELKHLNYFSDSLAGVVEFMNQEYEVIIKPKDYATYKNHWDSLNGNS